MKTKFKIGLVQINNSFSGQNYFPYSTGLLQVYASKYSKNIDDFEFILPIYKSSINRYFNFEDAKFIEPLLKKWIISYCKNSRK